MEFGDRIDVEHWLRHRSYIEARALAVRAALRAAPALRTTIGPSISFRNRRVDGALLYFGFALKAWNEAASIHPLMLGVEHLIADPRRTISDLNIYIETAQADLQDRTWDFMAAARAASASRYAASISTAVGIDAIRFAAEAVSEAAEAVSLAVKTPQSDPAVGEVMFGACASDAVLLEGGLPASQLLEQPLWLAGLPTWVTPNWAMVRSYLPLQNKRRTAWVRWYEQRLRGDAPHECKPLERCLEDLALRPAAIEPVWLNDRLNLADQPPHSQLGGETMLATLGALRGEMAELADDTALLPNCDPRPSQYLSRLAQRIPFDAPSQLYLFRLGSSRDGVRDFLPIVEREWPDLFVSRFRALLLQFDRTLGQFSKYRHYTDYRLGDDLTDAQVERASTVSRTVAEALENDENRSWLDPGISTALKKLEEPIALADGQLSLTPSIARNLLESISNIFKVLLEFAIKKLVPVAHWTKSTVTECGKAFAEHTRVSLIAEAGKAGDEVGRLVGKLLKHLGGAVIIGGSLAAVPVMTMLTQEFPTVFGWLKSFLCLIGWL